jgi:hypothetical protein
MLSLDHANPAPARDALDIDKLDRGVNVPNYGDLRPVDAKFCLQCTKPDQAAP